MAKIAMIHDWLIHPGGAEKVLREMLHLLQHHETDIYTLMDFMGEDDRSYYLLDKPTQQSFLQHIPGIKKNYRYYLPLFPIAASRFNLDKYDIIISSSHSVAKGVPKKKGQIHISYCHTPMRYLWDLKDEYMTDYNLNSGIKKWAVNAVLGRMQKWDIKTSNEVDYFIANSQNVKGRIKQHYQRDAHVIYPPVDTDFYADIHAERTHYVTASRMVPYKKMKLIIEAFSSVTGFKLVVIGDGPEYESIQKMASPNIEIIRYDSNTLLKHYLKRAKAFIFASNEDFGITPVEAMSCGTPVIAYGKGGVLETVVPGKTGIFFQHQSVKSIIDAVYQFEESIENFSHEDCREQAQKFNIARFRTELCSFLATHAKLDCHTE